MLQIIALVGADGRQKGSKSWEGPRVSSVVGVPHCLDSAVALPFRYGLNATLTSPDMERTLGIAMGKSLRGGKLWS